MHSGFTLVNFRDEATRDLILETGVIHFDKKTGGSSSLDARYGLSENGQVGTSLD